MKSLKEVEKLVGLTRRAIQEYEKEGLAMKPSTKDKHGYLLYDDPEINRLWQLKFYKELGYTIPDIKRFLDAQGFTQGELERVINDLKAKRNKLNNLISVAEAMRETGVEFNVLRNMTDIPEDDSYTDNVLKIMGLYSEQMKTAEVNYTSDCFLPRKLSEKEKAAADVLTRKLLGYEEEGCDVQEDKVQTIVMELHKILSKLTSKSVIQFRGFVIGCSANENLKTAFYNAYGKDPDFIYQASMYYCKKNVDNETDREFTDALHSIIALGAEKYMNDSEEIQNEVDRIYSYFKGLHIFTEKGVYVSMLTLRSIYGSQQMLDLMDENNPYGFAFFIYAALDYYIYTLNDNFPYFGTNFAAYCPAATSLCDFGPGFLRRLPSLL